MTATSSDRTAHIRAVARAEFGRRGYEGTSVRDIAAAAGLGPGTLFRLIGSKEALLASIMSSFNEKVDAGSKRVLRSEASPIAKLDALSWVDTNALDRFGDEFRIQLAWMRQIPPDTPNPSMQFPKRLRQIKSLLYHGNSVRRDQQPRRVRGDAGALRHPAQVDSGEHPAAGRHQGSTATRPRHNAARRHPG